MKKIIILFSLLLLNVFIQAQTVSCGHDEVSQVQGRNLKNYNEIFNRLNKEVSNYIATNYSSNAARPPANNTYMIPVVFHIVHPAGQAYGTGANIPYSQILSQLNAINAAFGMSYPAYNGQQHAAYAQNTNISFCLAKTAMPSNVSFYTGQAGIEYGVMRYGDNTLTNHQITNQSATALLGLTHPSATYFPFANYLNIWVVSAIGNGPGTTMGYAPTPIMNAYPLDGVVMRYDIIGDNSTGNNFPLGYGLQQGKVLTHEIGHYLNLYHIFQGGCAGANPAGSLTDACDLNGDFICDIEPCNTQNYNCNSPVPNTCGANYAVGTTTLDMIEDYMGYADDDCMNTFTADQSQRMWTTLNNLRFNLWQNSNLSATGIIGNGGCISAFLMTDIIKNTNNICAGLPLQLTNPTAGNSAISWLWNIAGASPSSGNSSSITVTFPSPGVYWAKLTVGNGSITAKDSIAIQVTNCTLDSTKLDRSHWYFGNYAEINFATSPASAGNAALTYSTIDQGYESVVSMSDKDGNLLFYTNSKDVWNRNHQQINATDVFENYSSTPGVIAVPYPQDSSRYILISSPHTGGDYDSIYYAVYDTVLQTISNKRGFRHNSLPSKFGEPLTVIPHCNGTDYWIICRPYYNIPNANSAYAMLLTPAGPQNIDTVIVSGNVTSAASGQLKSNPTGDRLIQASFGNGNAYFYNFNRATGQLSNQMSNTPIVSGIATGAIFSPDGSVAYVLSQSNQSGSYLYKVNVSTMATQTMALPAGGQGLQMETGPDNNIYMSQSSYNNTTIGRIINPNSFANSVFVPNVISFPSGSIPFGGLCNFMDARIDQVLTPDFTYTNITCSSFAFSTSNCWSLYKATWLFGDGTSGQGINVNHTYASSGVYPVQLILSIGNYSIAPVLKYITILPQTLAITGPTVLCKGNPYLNSYATSSVANASYTWSVINGGLQSANGLPFADVGSGSSGIMTVAVNVNNNGCLSSGTKTVVIDTIPTINFAPTSQVCLGSSINLSATPVGGVFAGVGVLGTVFTPMALGAHTVYYTATNSNGCSATRSLAITVAAAPVVNLTSSAQLCMGASLTLSANPPGGTFSGTGVTGSVFSVNTAGTYTVNYSVTSGGCVSNTTFSIVAGKCTGIAAWDNAPQALIYPNPSNAEFTIFLEKATDGYLEIYNAIGQLINTQSFSGSLTINIADHPDGIYTGRIQFKDSYATFKLVKQN